MDILTAPINVLGKEIPLAVVVLGTILIVGTATTCVLRRRLSRLLIFFVFADVFMGTALCQWYIYRIGVEYKTYHPYSKKVPGYLLDAISLTPRPDTLRLLSFGNTAVTADVLWIRGLQFYAQHYSRLTRPPAKGEGLVNLFLAIRDLDPCFEPTYRWGAFTTSDAMNDKERGYWRMSDRHPDGSRSLEWVGDPSTGMGDPTKGKRGAEIGIREFLIPAALTFPGNKPDAYLMDAAFTAWWSLDNRDMAVKILLYGASRAGRLAAVLMPGGRIPDWVFSNDYPNAPVVREFLNKLALVKKQGDSPEKMQQALQLFLGRLRGAATSGDEANAALSITHISEVFQRMMLLSLENAEKTYIREHLLAPESIADLTDVQPGPSDAKIPTPNRLIELIQGIQFYLQREFGEDRAKQLSLPWPIQDVFYYTQNGDGIGVKQQLEQDEGLQVQAINIVLKRHWDEGQNVPKDVEALYKLGGLKDLPESPFGNVYRIDAVSQPPTVSLEISIGPPSIEKRRRIAGERLQAFLQSAKKAGEDTRDVERTIERWKSAGGQSGN